MKIAILDDYQDQVRHLDCFRLLDGHEVKVFTTTARGIGQLALRLAGFDAVVLVRERTRLAKALLDKLPDLKLISQTGKVSGHIDVAAATARGIAIAEGVGADRSGGTDLGADHGRQPAPAAVLREPEGRPLADGLADS